MLYLVLSLKENKSCKISDIVLTYIALYILRILGEALGGGSWVFGL